MASDGDSTTTTTSSPRDINTYHCICTHLLLASTQPLAALPVRSTPDKASILRLPPASASHAPAEPTTDYAILLGTTLARDPIVIRGDRGFEKRYLHKCGRCDLTVGYQLDRAQYDDGAVAARPGRRDDVVYLLPGGLMTTQEMAEGKDMARELAIEPVNPV